MKAVPHTFLSPISFYGVCPKIRFYISGNLPAGYLSSEAMSIDIANNYSVVGL